MTAAPHRPFPLWASFFTLIGVTTLCVLGFWQLDRLAWKNRLLMAHAVSQSQEPMDFEMTAEHLAALPPDAVFVRGFVEGVFRHDAEIFLESRTYKGQPGYHVLTPFETLDNHVIIINRGWVPQEMKREGGFSRSEAPLIVTGTARRPDPPGAFTPANDPERNVWYRPDITEIAAAKSLDGVLPFILYSEDDTNDFPRAIATNWEPRNNHLGYALFWFSMAVVLAVIYGLRFFRRGGS